MSHEKATYAPVQTHEMLGGGAQSVRGSSAARAGTRKPFATALGFTSVGTRDLG